MLPAKPISNLASCIEDHDTGMSLVVIAPMHCVESLLPRRVPEIDQHVPSSHFCAVPGITVEHPFDNMFLMSHLYSVRA